MAQESLDDKAIGEFYKLGEELRGIPEEKYVKSLKGILHEEISKYFHEKKDKETHELKWEDDEKIKAFTSSLWDKAADHVAEHYLKMDEDAIRRLKEGKDPDTKESHFETLMASYLGIDKEGFFDIMKQNPTMNPENLLDYMRPLYEEHIKRRSSKKISYKIKTPEDATKLLEYTRLLKEHNPKTVKLRIPKKFKSLEETSKLYVQALGMLPETYHPKKPDTYAKK